MTISLITRAAMYSQETSEIFLVLLVLDHPELENPFRFVNNNVNFVSNGEEYIAWPFDIIFPDQTDDKEVTASLSISNVSRDISQAILLISSAPTIDISVVRASNPDVSELTLPTMLFSNISWDPVAVTGQLILTDTSNIVYPGRVMDPAGFPALF